MALIGKFGFGQKIVISFAKMFMMGDGLCVIVTESLKENPKKSRIFR